MSATFTHISRHSYDEWNALLCAHFFTPSNAGRPVVFFVDEDVLGEIALAEPGRASEDLQQAVLSKGSPPGLFEAIARETTRWKRGGALGCPPSLPLLALAVLGASRMAKEGGIAPHNYYERFRPLVGLTGSGPPPGYPNTIPMLWRGLAWWLDESQGGALGISTIQDHPHFSYIGYALSQALVRDSDRQQLTHFFQWIDLSEARELEADELLYYFRSWLPNRGTVSPGFRRMAIESSYEDQLKRLLELEARGWDGALRDERGRRIARIRLTFRAFPRPELGVVADYPEGFPEVTDFSGAGLRIASTVEEGWYRLYGLAVDERLLGQGLTLTAGSFVLSYQAAPVVPFRRDLTLGRYVSVRTIRPAEPHCVLVRDDHMPVVDEFVSRWAVDEGTRRPLASPGGWTMLKDVVIEQVGEDPPEELSSLVPTVKERLSVHDGLRLETGTYLTGGEPDVWVPSSLDAALVGVDDRKIEPDDRTAVVQLRQLGLGPGEHEVTAGPSRLSIVTVLSTGSKVARIDSLLGHVGRWEDGRLRPEGLVDLTRLPAGHADTLTISGAVIRGRELARSDAEPLLIPFGVREFWVIGSAPGQIERRLTPGRPLWMAHYGLHPRNFDFIPPFDVVWLVNVWQLRRDVRLVHELAPSKDSRFVSDSETVLQWHNVFAQQPGDLDETAAQLWSDYKSLAEELRAR